MEAQRLCAHKSSSSSERSTPLLSTSFASSRVEQAGHSIPPLPLPEAAQLHPLLLTKRASCETRFSVMVQP